MSKKIFEILCVNSIDNKETCVVRNSENLLNRVLGNGTLWKSASLKNETITDATLKIKLTSKILSMDTETTKNSFIVKIEGEDSLEQFRLSIIKHLKDEKFDFIYILTDDCSKEMAEKLYPKLYELENLLRKYLVTYFAPRIGPKWWANIAGEELNKKVQDRKNNETAFSKYMVKGRTEDLVDTKAFLIDFNDLGALIYRVSEGNLKSDDIVKQIEKLDITDAVSLATEVEKLKVNVKTNIKKHFPTFENINFQSKWEELYKTRNKIAHNSLMVKEDFEQSLLYADELIAFLKQENETLFTITFSEEEVALYQENIVKLSKRYTKISKSDLAFELHKTDDWTRRNNRPFIGLKHFAKDILGIKGYDIGTTYDLLNDLEREGYIEIYSYQDPSGGHTTQPTAIKIIKSLNDLFEKNS